MDKETLNTILEVAHRMGASDVHLSVGSPPRVRVVGPLRPLELPPLKPPDTMQLALSILKAAGKIAPNQTETMARVLRDEDCAYSAHGLGRFRVNIAVQRGTVALVLRLIPTQIATLEDLGLPRSVADIAMLERGLVLVTGITGAGKSTTLASMVAHINERRPCKIVTIEDPIEFVHRDHKASVMQREVGSDTASFAVALRAALRQDPDVILVGEMRDRETIDVALKAAETGHLVLSTLHTTDAPKTVSRLISVFEDTEQGVVRLRLADTLQAIISQRLVPVVDGHMRVPAVEVMRSTAAIKDCILNPAKTHTIPDLIRTGREQYGMQGFDQHLMELVEAGRVSVEVARSAATSPADFERNLLYV